MEIKIKKTRDSATIPKKAHKDDAGFDLYTTEDITLYSHVTTRVPLGFVIDIPAGYYGRIVGRSGMTSKTGVRVNEGTIDAGYHGEVSAMVDYIPGLNSQKLSNKYSKHSYDLKKGERFAQLIILKLPKVELAEVEEISESERGEKGFGSTGK